MNVYVRDPGLHALSLADGTTVYELAEPEFMSAGITCQLLGDTLFFERYDEQGDELPFSKLDLNTMASAPFLPEMAAGSNSILLTEQVFLSVLSLGSWQTAYPQSNCLYAIELDV